MRRQHSRSRSPTTWRYPLVQPTGDHHYTSTFQSTAGIFQSNTNTFQSTRSLSNQTGVFQLNTGTFQSNTGIFQSNTHFPIKQACDRCPAPLSVPPSTLAPRWRRRCRLRLTGESLPPHLISTTSQPRPHQADDHPPYPPTHSRRRRSGAADAVNDGCVSGFWALARSGAKYAHCHELYACYASMY